MSPPTRLLHLSDCHFGTERPEAVEALVTAVAELDPDLIVFSGDITQRARRREFNAARRFIARLGARNWLAVPGNHDISLFNPFSRVLVPYLGYRRFHEDLRPRVRLPSVEVIGFISAQWYRHVDGEVDIPQAEARLAEYDDGADLRIAVLHHPFDCRQALDQHNLIHGAEDLLHAFSRQRVGLVLGGHIHDPFVSNATTRYQFPDGMHGPVLALAGTCISHRTRYGAPNSFNLIEFSNGKTEALTIARHDLAGDGRRFEAVSVSHFQRKQGGAWQVPAPSAARRKEAVSP